jgi:tRNA dimethylallyltransferase
MPFLRQKILAIVGPTASGKTSLSIELAKKYDGEVISADSRQIYRGMDIGTAKAPISPEPASNAGSVAKLSVPAKAGTQGYLSEGIPHHLVDIKNPDEDYSVADFKKDANAAIEVIVKKGKLPMLVGGTGLYVWAVLDNLDIPEIKADPVLRAKIEKDVQEKGLAAVFEELVALDPEAAYVVDPKNPRRVIRALEVAITTGKPFTAQRTKKDSPYDALMLGINPAPEILRERINLRIDLMMRDGLVDEVKRLVERYGDQCVAFDAIGYREIIDFLKGKISLEKAAEDMKLNTWHYAKRQMTWFKRDKKIHWIENAQEAEFLVETFLKG